MTPGKATTPTRAATHEHASHEHLSDGAISERLAQSVGGRYTYAELARQSGLSAATIRRYLLGHAPAPAFLAWTVLQMDVSPFFLLLGSGPVSERERCDEALRAFPTQRLQEELGRRQAELERTILTLTSSVESAATAPLPGIGI